MTVIKTTGWARELAKTPEQWQAWLASLKDGDLVLYQEFVPRSDMILGSPVEYWRFWPATYTQGGTRVRYDNEMHRIKDGMGVYWNSDNPVGDVFPSRIVPYHRDLAGGKRALPDYNDGGLCVPGFVSANGPSFEPAWFSADRCFVLNRNHPKAGHKVQKRFPHQYRNRCHSGDIITIFADGYEVAEWVKEIQSEEPERADAISFLYSQDVEK